MTEIASERVVVLVVEDDPNIRSLLTDVLSDEGYDVVGSANGSEAFSVLSTIWPNPITLDLNLPDTTGEAVLQKIHAPDETRKPPVVIITANRSIAPEIRKLAQAVVPKPFGLDELLQIIRNLVPPPEREQANEAAR